MRFNFEDEERRAAQPKSELRRMLAEALKNTGGVPVDAPARNVAPSSPPIAAPPPPPAKPPVRVALPPPSAALAVKPTTAPPAKPPRRTKPPEPTRLPAHRVPAHRVAAAAAITAAAQETGADPAKVAQGIVSRAGQNRDVARARAYAARALESVFPDVNATALGHLVAAGTADCYLAVLRQQQDRGGLRWWDQRAFERVCEAAWKAVA